jgi:hypothetical protein
MINNIPAPVTFNPWKHHFNFINEHIHFWQGAGWKNVEPYILKTGNNLLDLYLGKLGVNRICDECLEYLKEKSLLEKPHLLKWLAPAGYQKIELSDKSVWIVKEAAEPDRYIHIHPAKNSFLTIRVRGATLKTVVAIAVLRDNIRDKTLTLHEVNTIRTGYLDLSPVKSIQAGKGILKFWHFFCSQQG